MSKEAMKLALEAFQRLDLWLKVRYQVGLVGFELDAIKALEEALAKQEQGEPVAWADHGVVNWIADKQFQHESYLYTTPQQRKPLTLEQIREHWQVAKVLDMTDAEIDFADYVLITRDVEALHSIKE